MKKTLYLLMLVFCLPLLFTACGGKELPPDDGTPEPEPHNGVFTSEYGRLSFNGDGESISFAFSEELAKATGLPAGEQSGSYVFLFQHGEWRYDKAERFRISAGAASYDFVHDFTLADENTIALQSPIDAKETLLFKKEGK